MDYALHSNDPTWRMSCKCGTRECRGVVTGRDWMDADLQLRYAGHFSPYLAQRYSLLRNP